MDATFRLRKSIRHQGAVCALVFTTATILYSSIFFLEEPEEHGFKGEHSVAFVGTMGTIIFGGMLLLSTYMLIAYYVERFSIQGTTISTKSVFQNRRFCAAEIQTLTWKTRPAGGSIVFRLLDQRAKLELYGFSRADRLQIIRLLRRVIPEAKQEDWPLFCYRIALPLRDASKPLVRTDPTPATEVLITRGR